MTLLVETFTFLLIAIVSSSYAAAIITEKIWIPAKVTDITAIESSSTHTHSVSAPSLTVCIGAAFALNWPKLACYYPSKATNQCILWGEDAFYLTSITMQPEGAPADCRVKNTCDSWNDIEVGLGDSIPNINCPDTFTDVCSVNGIQPDFSMFRAPLTSCDSPFSLITASSYSFCIYISKQKVTFCEARKICLEMGGDMSAFSDADQFAAFREYLASSGVTHFWMGVNEVKEEIWLWNKYSRIVSSVELHEWGEGEPDDGDIDAECTRISEYRDYRLGDDSCDEEFHFICRAYI